MNITPDTNVLLRVLTNDDPIQSPIARAELKAAEQFAVTVTALCETVWVLSYSYKIARSDIAAAIRGLLGSKNATYDHQTTQAGLALLDRGGDFADGVIAHEGARLGGAIFTSFDKHAVALFEIQGNQTKLL